MKNNIFNSACITVAAGLISLLGGCASYDSDYPAQSRAPQYDNRDQYDSRPYDDRDQSQYGTVRDIEIISADSGTSGGGAVLGAILGAAIGHQVGDGTGRKVATGVGAVSGAVIGNNIERRNNRDDEIFRVRVRMNNGREYTAEYRNIGDMEIGDRVRIEDGQIYRM